MASSKEVEGLLRRVQVLYTHKFLKQCAALLMDFPELRFSLLDLCQQWRCGAVTEVVSTNTSFFFRRTVVALEKFKKQGNPPISMTTPSHLWPLGST